MYHKVETKMVVLQILFGSSWPEQRTLGPGSHRPSLQSHQTTADKQMRWQRKRRRWSWQWLWTCPISASPTANSGGSIEMEQSARQCTVRTCKRKQTRLSSDECDGLSRFIPNP